MSAKKTVTVLREFGNIGDILMMTPAIRGLSQKCNHKINIVLPQKYMQVVENIPYIGEILSSENFDIELYRQKGGTVYNLSNYEFDYEQIHQPAIEKTKIELFCEACNVPYKSNKLDIELTKKEINCGIEFIKKNNLKNKTTVLCAISAANESREWGIENWKKLIKDLKNANYLPIICDEKIIWEDDQVIFFSGRSIRELFGLANAVDMIICQDSGLLHIGAALDKKTISIFGPTSPHLRCVYEKSHYVWAPLTCTPCWYNRCKTVECMQMIQSSKVFDKILEVETNYD